MFYIVENFYSQLLSLTICPECYYFTSNHDPIQVISLELPNDAKTIYEDNTWAMLQFDNIKLALVVEDEHPYHIAFEVDEVDGKTHRDGSVSKYIDDPSGNKIELIKYTKNT